VWKKVNNFRAWILYRNFVAPQIVILIWTDRMDWQTVIVQH